MEISVPNEYGAMSYGTEEVVAQRGRSRATVAIAICEDGLYRQATGLLYSYGGFCGPIFMSAQGYATAEAARTAALEELLQECRSPFASDPQSVHDELADLRRQIESQLRQPSLF